MRFEWIAVFLLLAGCQSTGMTMYGYKDGATVKQKDRDSFECELSATQQVPTNSQIGTTPAYTTPVQVNCVGSTCYTTGGQTYGGQTYSYDANESLRREYFQRCLAQKGYRTVELPKCDSESVPDGLRQKLSGRLRPPKEGACVAQVTNRVGNVVYSEELTR